MAKEIEKMNGSDWKKGAAMEPTTGEVRVAESSRVRATGNSPSYPLEGAGRPFEHKEVREKLGHKLWKIDPKTGEKIEVVEEQTSPAPEEAPRSIFDVARGGS